jgi:hypothetical protein
MAELVLSVVLSIECPALGGEAQLVEHVDQAVDGLVRAGDIWRRFQL